MLEIPAKNGMARHPSDMHPNGGTHMSALSHLPVARRLSVLVEVSWPILVLDRISSGIGICRSQSLAVPLPTAITPLSQN